ncbi:MAG: DUF116 domain-containing protein [Methanocorpusculum sp.]|nr:DUF116 domain-containing protein [Methanocorpusculum sp.]
MTDYLPVAIFDAPVWNSIVFLLGELVIIILILWIILSFLIGFLIALSIKKKKMYLPHLLRPVLTLMEGTVRLVCLMFGVDSTQLMEFLIKIDNQMNYSAFAKVPVEKRAVFIPLCLRSAKCPARLSPDVGISCISCGKCPLGDAIPVLKDAGYMTFIIPGSTFIKRLVKKYRPQAMIGVGCLMEVKEGLELGRKISMTTIGVVTTTDGCVETTMDYDMLMKAASIGLATELRMPEKQ